MQASILAVWNGAIVVVKSAASNPGNRPVQRHVLLSGPLTAAP